MGKIFISYRRNDTLSETGRIYDNLVNHFGEEKVFRDLDSIPVGVDFRELIFNKMKESKVLLLIIGKEWLQKTGKKKSRLQDPQDYVRIELEEALKLGATIIPVQIDNADIPSVKDLPGVLHGLSTLHAIKVDSGGDFRHHMDKLIKRLEELLVEPPPPPPPPPPKTTSVTDENILVSVEALHSHGYGSCEGKLLVSEKGIRYDGSPHKARHPFSKDIEFVFTDNTDGHARGMSTGPWLRIRWVEGASIASYRLYSRDDFRAVKNIVEKYSLSKVINN